MTTRLEPVSAESVLTYAEASALLSYDPATGIVTRKVRQGTQVAGKRAGSLNSDGYRYIKVKHHRYSEHRLCWLLHYGAWPERCLDHVDMNKTNNRPGNLRLATNSENSRNKARQANNTSGFKGVSFSKAVGKFGARIQCAGKTTHLGYFPTAEEAGKAYAAAVQDVHQDFARTA